MSVIKLDPRLMLPAVNRTNECASTIEYSIGPQRDTIAADVETESVARAKF